MKALKDSKRTRQARQFKHLGYLEGLTYQNLVDILGEPTYIRKYKGNTWRTMWAVRHKGNLFTIYDWGNQDLRETQEETIKWRVGGYTDIDGLRARLAFKADQLYRLRYSNN